jgi:hypothetical protein
MKFFPFGDSHTYFWGGQKNYPGQSLDNDIPIMGWLGTAKAYGLTNDTQNKTFEKYTQLKPYLSHIDVIPIACFGEIDIRVNCSRSFLFNGSEDIVTGLVDQYLAVISMIPNEQIVICGPPPSAPDNGMFNSELPAYGDNQMRNYLTHVFNKRIIQSIHNFPNLKFITLFYDLIDEDLKTNDRALHDGCHMNVEFQPMAKEALIRTINDSTKLTLNISKYQKIVKYKRAFKEVDNFESTPYINYYKQPSSQTPEYFSYSPNTSVLGKTLVSYIHKIEI